MTTTGDPVPLLSERTLRTYAADWALLADWSAVTGNPDLPAHPDTVVAFLADCPAAPKTHRGRVAAIDHHHAATGHAPPGRSPAVLAVLGRPTGAPHQPSPDAAAVVDTALRALPSHGWTQGMFGRRDRCLLVLSQLGGVPYKDLATLTAGAITLTGGIAVITTTDQSRSVAPVDDPVSCGPCAVVRWLRVLDLAATTISTGSSPTRSTRPTRSPATHRTCAAPPGHWTTRPWPPRCWRRSTSGEHCHSRCRGSHRIPSPAGPVISSPATSERIVS